eukprot:SAG31_NODE_2631_length_5350_cov_1.613026_3_plen_566_part_00
MENGVAAAASVSECCQRCDERPGCRGWSLCNATEARFPPTCSLKSRDIDNVSPREAAELQSTTRRTINPSCVSGYVPPPSKTAPAPGPRASTSEPDRSSAPTATSVRWAELLQTALADQQPIAVAPDGGALSACEEHCAADDRCFGFVRDRRTGGCRFFPRGVRQIPSEHEDSYTIIRPQAEPAESPHTCRDLLRNCVGVERGVFANGCATLLTDLHPGNTANATIADACQVSCGVCRPSCQPDRSGFDCVELAGFDPNSRVASASPSAVDTAGAGGLQRQGCSTQVARRSGFRSDSTATVADVCPTTCEVGGCHDIFHGSNRDRDCHDLLDDCTEVHEQCVQQEIPISIACEYLRGASLHSALSNITLMHLCPSFCFQDCREHTQGVGPAPDPGHDLQPVWTPPTPSEPVAESDHNSVLFRVVLFLLFMFCPATVCLVFVRRLFGTRSRLGVSNSTIEESFPDLRPELDPSANVEARNVVAGQVSKCYLIARTTTMTDWTSVSGPGWRSYRPGLSNRQSTTWVHPLISYSATATLSLTLRCVFPLRVKVLTGEVVSVPTRIPVT